MSTNVKDFGWDESEDTLVIETVSALSGLSSFEPTHVDMQEAGVLFDFLLSSVPTRYFVPWHNVKFIRQGL